MMRRFFAVLLSCLLLTSTALADKTVTLTFAGDVTLGGEDRLRDKPYSFHAKVAEMGYDYFFLHVRDLFGEDDLTVVNLEGVLSDSNRGEVKDKTYRFRGPADFVNILLLGSVEAATIANNHTRDFGQQGYDATLANLQNADVAAFGDRTVYIFEKDGIKIALMGLNTTAFTSSKEWITAEMTRLKAEEGVNAIVFLFHGGQEYGKHRNKVQTLAAHHAINAGADLVIMHHPHVVQGMEIYKNRTICYSLGNFCFGGNKRVRALEALIARAALTFSDSGEYLGQQLSLYPCHISGTTPESNYQPVLVTGDDAAEVMRLVQFDTDFDLVPFSDDLGCAPQAYVPAE